MVNAISHGESAKIGYSEPFVACFPPRAPCGMRSWLVHARAAVRAPRRPNPDIFGARSPLNGGGAIGPLMHIGRRWTSVPPASAAIWHGSSVAAHPQSCGGVE